MSVCETYFQHHSGNQLFACNYITDLPSVTEAACGSRLSLNRLLCVCLVDILNQEQHGVRGGINETLCVQPPAAAGGGQVVQCEVHTCQQPQCLLHPHRQVALEASTLKKVNVLFLLLIIIIIIFLIVGNVFRNNLTVIDTILLHGRGTTESLKVAGKPPGQGSSLRFKMTEALLKECTESESAVHIAVPSPLRFSSAVPTVPECDLIHPFKSPRPPWLN